MIVETAVPRDIPALTQLRLAYLEDDLGPIEPQTRNALELSIPLYLEKHLGTDLTAYVAREGSEIAACAFLLVVEKPPNPDFTVKRTGTVLNVYTRPEYRRHGYARQVMERLLEDAAQQDICLVELNATEDGYPLYRSVGFTDMVNQYRPMKWTMERK